MGQACVYDPDDGHGLCPLPILRLMKTTYWLPGRRLKSRIISNINSIAGLLDHK